MMQTNSQDDCCCHQPVDVVSSGIRTSSLSLTEKNVSAVADNIHYPRNGSKNMEYTFSLKCGSQFDATATTSLQSQKKCSAVSNSSVTSSNSDSKSVIQKQGKKIIANSMIVFQKYNYQRLISRRKLVLLNKSTCLLFLVLISLLVQLQLVPTSLLLPTVTAKKVDTSSSCTLPCQNSGQCIKGKDHVIRGYGETTSTTTDLSSSGQQQQEEETTTTIKTDYCSCLKGYTGAYCEIKYLPCPDTVDNDGDTGTFGSSKGIVGKHGGGGGICTNGAQCTIAYADTDNTKYYHCFCDYTNSDLSTPYARQFCQKVSTVFCSITDEQRTEKDDYRKSLGTVSNSFCYNGGQCIESNAISIDDTPLRGKKTNKVSHHAGCTCPPGWVGTHCEKPDIRINTQYATKPNNKDPLFLQNHLQNIQQTRINNELYQKQHATSRSFISYLLSFIITFLLIFTIIGAIFYCYINYFQHQMIISNNGQTSHSNNLLNSVIILSNNSNNIGNNSSSSSSKHGRTTTSSRVSRGSNGSRTKKSSTKTSKKLNASERARIPKHVREQQHQQHSNNNSSNSSFNNNNYINNSSESNIDTNIMNNTGYNSSSDMSQQSSSRQRHRSTSNNSLRPGRIVSQGLDNEST